MCRRAQGGFMTIRVKPQGHKVSIHFYSAYLTSLCIPDSYKKTLLAMRACTQWPDGLQMIGQVIPPPPQVFHDTSPKHHT